MTTLELLATASHNARLTRLARMHSLPAEWAALVQRLPAGAVVGLPFQFMLPSSGPWTLRWRDDTQVMELVLDATTGSALPLNADGMRIVLPGHPDDTTRLAFCEEAVKALAFLLMPRHVARGKLDR